MSRAKIFNYILKRRLDKQTNDVIVTIFSNCSLRGLNFTQRSEGKIVDTDFKQDVVKLKSIQDSIVDIDLKLISYIQIHLPWQEFKADPKKIKDAKKNQYDESDVKHTDDKVKIVALKNASPGQKVMVLTQEAGSPRLQSFIGIIEEIDWKHGFLCIWSQHGKNYCLILDTLICPFPLPPSTLQSISSSSATSRPALSAPLQPTLSSSAPVKSIKSSRKDGQDVKDVKVEECVDKKVNENKTATAVNSSLNNGDHSKKSDKSKNSKKSNKKRDKKDKHKKDKKDKKDNESKISKLIKNFKD